MGEAIAQDLGRKDLATMVVSQLKSVYTSCLYYSTTMTTSCTVFLQFLRGSTFWLFNIYLCAFIVVIYELRSENNSGKLVLSLHHVCQAWEQTPSVAEPSQFPFFFFFGRGRVSLYLILAQNSLCQVAVSLRQSSHMCHHYILQF